MTRFDDSLSTSPQDAAEVAALDINPRARNILLNMGITTLAELQKLTRDRFMAEWRAGDRLWQQVAPYTAEAVRHVRVVHPLRPRGLRG